MWKAFFLDVGLAGTANGNSAQSLADFLGGGFLDEGALAEQFVAQEIASAQPRSQRARSHYWLREGKSQNAELDFLVAAGNTVLPVEVKSGTSGSLRSLHQSMLSHKGGRAVRLDLNEPSMQEINTEVMSAEGKQQVSYRLANLPLYLAGRLSSLML